MSGIAQVDVLFRLAEGLDGGGEYKLGKRVRAMAGGSEYDVVQLLSSLERTTGLSAACHRIIAMAKAILRGEASRIESFNAWIDYMNGVGPAPKDAPN